VPTARKVAEVEELRDMISRAVVSISTEYRGLSVAEMIALRRRMREAGVEVRVVKNTLFKLAAEQAGQPQVAEIANGPTAVVFGYGDISSPAKALQEYMRTARNALTVQAAYVEGRVMPASALADLANLPSRDQLIAGFMGGLRGPIATFAGLMSATIQQFAGLIDSRANQLEGNAA
jgi:large subunit ribosomal protein L10